MISNSLDIDFIRSDIHALSCKKYGINDISSVYNDLHPTCDCMSDFSPISLVMYTYFTQPDGQMCL